MYGQDLNPYVYELMDAASDHLHWGGGHWTEGRGGKENDAAGGGHAHSGTLIYLGDSFPKEYYGTLFTCNIHGNRVNNDALERKGSGWVANHRPDFFKANDPWFRGVALAMGPDGGMYIADWSDTGECHDYELVHRNSGRIYKVTYSQFKRADYDLAKLDNAELIRCQVKENEWRVRTARRILAERSKTNRAVDFRSAAHSIGEANFLSLSDIRLPLRYLWTSFVTGSVSAEELLQWTHHDNEIVRANAIRLAGDLEIAGAIADRLGVMAETEPSSYVRLALASALQRAAIKGRWPLIGKLIAPCGRRSRQRHPTHAVVRHRALRPKRTTTCT